MNVRTRVIAIVALLMPLPVLAQTAVYVRPTIAIILAMVFGIIAVGCIIKAAQEWSYYRAVPVDGSGVEQQRSMQPVIIWSIASAVMIAATVIAALWRVSRPLTSAPANIERSQSVGAVKILTIDRHWPERDASSIPSNSSLYLWFDQSMDRKTIIDDRTTSDLADDLASDRFVRIWQGGSIASPGPLVAARARSNSAATVFALDPLKNLSTGARETKIFVELKGLRTADGQPLFGAEGVYRWSFTVGQSENRNPPMLGETFPRSGSTNVAANAGIQLAWNTMIDPLSFESGLEVRVGKTASEGQWTVAEGERLTEFFPAGRCGQNQCRRDVRCFPFVGAVSVWVRAVDPNSYPRVGVRDFQGNLLPAQSKALVSYSTGQQLNQSTPRIVEVQPSPDSSGIDPNTPVNARFSTILRAGSVDRRSVRLGGDGAWRARVGTNFTAQQSTISITHAPFAAAAVLQGLISSDVEDIYQNCFAQCEGP
ncbi:hypothetical protein HZA86_00640 [Candidatus Uhrbacteria bacterium]|nr:hypothetical protein [Candidatus Uhrbacteria bacterium]